MISPENYGTTLQDLFSTNSSPILSEISLVDDEKHIGSHCITVGRQTHMGQEVLEGKASTSHAVLATSNLKTCYALAFSIRRNTDGKKSVFLAHVNQHTKREELIASIKKFINGNEVINIGFWGGRSISETTDGTAPQEIIRTVLAEVFKTQGHETDRFFQGTIAKEDVLIVAPSGQCFLANPSREPSLVRREVSSVDLHTFEKLHQRYLKSSLLRFFVRPSPTQSDSTRKLIQECLSSETPDNQRFIKLKEYFQNTDNKGKAFYQILEDNAEALNLKESVSCPTSLRWQP